MRRARWVVAGVAAGMVAVSCATFVELESRAIREGQGVMADGKQLRYREAPFTGVPADFQQFASLAYRDERKAPPPQKVTMPADVKGDPALGRKLFMDRAKAPCTGCHLIRGDDVWPAGNIGPDLSMFGARGSPNDYLYQYIYDGRVFNPETPMPPWGTMGIYTPAEIVHMVAFLQAQKGPQPPEKDAARDPNTRPKPVYYFGDNLDPVINPAVVLAEGAAPLWTRKGPAGKSCADCHEGGIAKTMRGVATKYPKFVAQFGRVMSMEDLLAHHGAGTTGLPLHAQSDDNLNLSVLVKMQSNGMPVAVDVASRQAAAALERGKANFYRRVGQRNHACADCHDPVRGGDKFLGGRLLAKTEDGMTKHFPTFRTNFGLIWDMRKRMQWCMLPLGMNYLPADAVEYAEIELYLTSFDRGKPMSVPGIRH